MSEQEISMQELVQMGLNAFALQLLVESLPNVEHGEAWHKLEFRFRGAEITIEFDDNLDRRHH